MPERPADLADEPPFVLGGLTVRPPTREVVAGDGAAEALEPRVMKVLVVLARSRGQVVSRAQLVFACWDGRIVGDDAINRCIQALRRLAAARGGFEITTISRVGYRLDETGAATAPAREPAGAPEPKPIAGPEPDPARRRRWAALAIGAGLVVVAVAVAWMALRPAEPRSYTLAIGAFRALDGAAPKDLPTVLQHQIEAAFDSDKIIDIVDGGRADFTLNGAVSRAGDRLHYAMWLEDRSGQRLRSWSQDTAQDSLRSATQVAVGVSGFLRCGLVPLAEHGRRIGRHARSMHFELCGGGTARRRIDIAANLVREEPRFAAGWSQMAYAYGSAAFGAAPQDAPALRRQGLEAAKRALALNPGSSSAYRVMSWLQPPGTPYAEVEALLKKAISTPNTDCSCEHRDYGDFLMDVGRVDEALGEYQRSIDIEAGGSEQLSLAHAWFFDGQPARAQEVLRTVEAAWGDKSWIAFARLDAAISRRDWAGAARLIREDAETDTERTMADAFDAVAAGDRARMAALLPAIRRLAAAPSLDGWKARPPMLEERPALLLALMGRPDEALAAVSRLMDRYGPDGGQLLFNPLVAGLRHDPGYLPLLERKGLVAYWRTSGTRPDFCQAADAPAFCAGLR
ncbi:winged helix-turn-helix domain-containing protein [Phenylobacterium sp.]|uniref:winged helix-turn-helix domain-containing protein n=1 Tax=Phenylobacterium sp. TaxID=1871053 RepID=UPI0025E5CDA1|nr:winged helix-turn-helix domain-containing protein [Phenylobacterium sp.]MBX3484351.1 winged helix-turn-helix domain-containing protein [Phenylobacterium sp.]